MTTEKCLALDYVHALRTDAKGEVLLLLRERVLRLDCFQDATADDLTYAHRSP